METKKTRFDLSQIGEADKRNLCSTFLGAVNSFYDNPANVRKFEAWKKARNAKQNQ